MASSVAQPLERQFAQIPGIAQMTSTSYLGTAVDHHPVRPQPQHRRRRQRRAGRRSTPPAASCRKTFRSPPTYRKVNPADSPILLLSATSDTLPLTDVERLPSTPSWRSRSARSPAWRRSPSAASRSPSIRVQIDPAKLVAKGLSLEDVRSQIAITTVDSPKGNIDGDTRSLHDLCQRPAAGRQGLERRHHRLSQWRPVAGPRHRPGGDRSGRRQAGGLGQRQARRVPGGLQAARRQRHRHRRQDQGAAAAAGRGDSARDQDRHHQRPHPDHSRRGRGRAVHAAADHRARRDGDLRLPAQFLGDGDPEPSRCRWRCSAPAR